MDIQYEEMRNNFKDKNEIISTSKRYLNDFGDYLIIDEQKVFNNSEKNRKSIS